MINLFAAPLTRWARATLPGVITISIWQTHYPPLAFCQGFTMIDVMIKAAIIALLRSAALPLS
jgi:hypothetical protein